MNECREMRKANVQESANVATGILRIGAKIAEVPLPYILTAGT